MILGVSFYAVAILLINLVGDYLFDTKINQERATVEALAVRFAPIFGGGDAEELYLDMREVGGRLLVLDMDGKVQVDSFSELNGKRLGHPEVVSVLNGASRDHDFHLLNQRGESADDPDQRAIFDFLRNDQSGRRYVGYFTAALVHNGSRIGVVLHSVSVQDMIINLRVMQDQMLLYFFLAAAAVFVISLVFSRVITKPIATLTESIKRMARGDLSGRVKVSGNDEMARMSETFNQMSEKLENLDTSRNEFVSNASHELKTPLATMKIMLESMLYQDDMDPALRQEFMTDINKELDRLSSIVTDLLTLVRSDSNDYQLTMKPVLLREIVEETLHRLKPMAKEYGQNMTLKSLSDCAITADPVKLQQIIYNLVDNAVKYSPKGSEVRVTVKQEGKNAILEVADNGPGIPKKDQAHIFDRFYRVDKARARATGGNGLGLSIVHQAVLLHEGRVSVHSEEGKGSTFRVELPIKKLSGDRGQNETQ